MTTSRVGAVAISEKKATSRTCSLALPPSSVRARSRPIVQLVRLELPAELDDALRMSGLHAAYAKLSTLQRSCYAEWVGDGTDANARWERASLVCRVIRPVS